MMDVDNGKGLQSLPVSGGVDANIFEADTSLLRVATVDGKIYISQRILPTSSRKWRLLQPSLEQRRWALIRRRFIFNL
jgi:hypothetical protein